MTIGERVRTATARAFLGVVGAWERLESGVAFKIGTPQFLEDPH